MNAKLTRIAHHRANLIERAAAQRSEIGYLAQPWISPLSFIDRGAALMRRVRMHPLAVAIGVLLVLRLGRSGWSLWAGRLWTGWQLYQTLQNQQSRPRD